MFVLRDPHLTTYHSNIGVQVLLYILHLDMSILPLLARTLPTFFEILTSNQIHKILLCGTDMIMRNILYI